MRQRPPSELSQGRNGEMHNCSFEDAHYSCGRVFEGPEERRQKSKRRKVEKSSGEARWSVGEEKDGMDGLRWRKVLVIQPAVYSI